MPPRSICCIKAGVLNGNRHGYNDFSQMSSVYIDLLTPDPKAVKTEIYKAIILSSLILILVVSEVIK